MPRKSAKKPSTLHRVKRGVKHTVVPHKGNDYHPHLIRRWGIVAVLLIVALLQIIPHHAGHQSVLGKGTDVTSQRLLDDTNLERSKADIAPLTINTQLSAAATSKARDMFKEQYWAHVSPNGTTPWYWFKDANYQYASAGENLAKGFNTSSGLIAAWMDSSEHRSNILNPKYSEVGFAVIEGRLNDEDTKLVVAMYGSPLGADTVGSTQTVLAATGSASVMARLGSTLQTLAPTVLASLILLLFTAMVALTAHMHRRYLPRPMLRSWKRHHGLYKAIGMTSIVIVLIALYGGGQII